MSLTLPILKTTMALPAFHATGHDVAALPDHASYDKHQALLPFDLRDYPDVQRLLARDDHSGQVTPPHPIGVWTADLVLYSRDDGGDIARWLAVKKWYLSEVARRWLFLRLCKPVAILERMIFANLITDSGATAMNKVFGTAAPTLFYNHLQLATGAVTDALSGVTANVSTTMASTGVTAIPVVSGGASFTNGMTIGLGVNTANVEALTVGASSTGTSIVCSATTKTHAIGDLVAQSYLAAVTALPVAAGGASFTNTMSINAGWGSANSETVIVGSGSTGTSVVTAATGKAHYANDWLVQNPLTADNPSSVANGYDSGALAGGAFTYSGTGAGNRQVQVLYNFPANGSAPAAGYTDLWLASAATIASNTTGSHSTRPPLLVNSTTGANLTYTEQL